MTRICKYSNICEKLCKYLKSIFTVKTETRIHTNTSVNCLNMGRKMWKKKCHVANKWGKTRQNWRLLANWAVFFSLYFRDYKKLIETTQKHEAKTEIWQHEHKNEFSISFIFSSFFVFVQFDRGNAHTHTHSLEIINSRTSRRIIFTCNIWTHPQARTLWMKWRKSLANTTDKKGPNQQDPDKMK